MIRHGPLSGISLAFAIANLAVDIDPAWMQRKREERAREYEAIKARLAAEHEAQQIAAAERIAAAQARRERRQAKRLAVIARQMDKVQ